MKKLLPKLLLGAAGVWVGSMLIYWFNLDNKAIYFLVRPLLDKLYDQNLMYFKELSMYILAGKIKQ